MSGNTQEKITEVRERKMSNEENGKKQTKYITWDEGLTIDKLWNAPEFQKAHSMARSMIQEYILELDMLYQAKMGNSLIRLMESRMKSVEGIERKLERKNLDKTVWNMLEGLHDISGVRVICYDIKQIYWLARRIADEGRYEVVKVKDYVRRPKKNGYESYHIVCNVPVSMDGKDHLIKVEIQIRTIIMDAWASLDSKLRYKKNESISEEMELRIRKYAKWSRRMDKLVRDIMKLSGSTET